MRATIRSVVLSALLIALVSAAAHAQFTVYDPTNYFQALARYAQLLEQYRFWVAQARRLPVDMATRYRLSPLRWQSHDIAGTYTYAQPIISALNVGDASGLLYDAGTDPLAALADLLTSVPADLRPRLRTIYGSIQLDDSAAKMAINQIGSTRVNGRLALTAIQNMEDDEVSTADTFHTQTALLNKINGANVLGLRLNETATQLELHILEQLLVQNKRTRDAEAEIMNAHLFQWRYGPAYARDLYSRTAASLDSWRQP